MHVREGGDELRGDGPRFVLWYLRRGGGGPSATAIDKVEERLTGDVLEHDAEDGVGVVHFEHAHHVPVRVVNG